MARLHLPNEPATCSFCSESFPKKLMHLVEHLYICQKCVNILGEHNPVIR